MQQAAPQGGESRQSAGEIARPQPVAPRLASPSHNAAPASTLPPASQFLTNTRTAESGQPYDISLKPEHLLGRGQFSVGVRLAQAAGEPRAAKQIADEKQARREFQVHQDLASHPAGPSPYLVKAFDIAVQYKGSSHLLMESFSGPDGETALNTLLEDPSKSGPQKAAEILDTARHYVIALGELNRRGYQHGDTDNLKNFFSEGPRIALGDYGLSRKLGAPANPATLGQLHSDRFGLGMLLSRMQKTAEGAGVFVPGLRIAANALMSGTSTTQLRNNWAQVEAAQRD